MQTGTPFQDHFSTASDDYKRFRPLYPHALFDYLARISPATQRAWDCGCGNGQATVELARHFTQVTGSDASAAQIAQAQPADNVQYVVSPAEILATPDESLDLLTVAQAIHWFDHPRFFREANRALKPGGVLAAWGYQLLYTDSALDAVIEDFHSHIVGPYWPPERALLDNGYSRIVFPYPRLSFQQEGTPEFRMTARWQFSHLLGYLNTWSAVKQYEKAQGRSPIEQQFDRLLQAWGDPATERAIYWPLILYVGKKPA